MKKFSFVILVAALMLSSLACKALAGAMGGNNDGGITPPGDSSGIATLPPITTDGGNVTVGESPFPVTSDAFNVVSTPQSVTFQTKLSADDVMKFYRDELGKQGLTEDSSMTTNFNGIVAMFFKDSNGKTVVLGGAPTGDGSLTVTLAYQQ